MSSLVHQFTEDAGGLSTPASFSCLDLRVRKAILELEKEKTGNWIHTIATIAGIIGVGCLSPAAPALAIGGGVAGLGTLIYGHGQFFGTKGHQLHRLTLLAAAMADATAEQWSQLHYATDGNNEVFLKALESGMLLAENGVEKQGAIFRKAAEYIDTANKGAIEGYVPRPSTALIEPQKRREVIPVTIDEVDAICLICVKAIAQSPDTAWSQKIIDQAAELKGTNHQACTNKLIFHSKLTDRQFAAEGITKDRLKLIKAWAAEGAKPGAVVVPIAVPPVAPIVEPEVTPIAVAPTLHHVAPVVAIVEPEPDYEFDIAEYEDESVKPIAVQAVAKPKFFQAGAVRQNSGLLTAKDLIEACMKEAYRSMALIGGERSGKTYFASVFSQRQQVEGGTTITYINLYDANGDAADDWEHADHVITANLNDDRCDVEMVLRAVYARLRAFQKETNTHLYFDEWVAFTSVSNAWEKKASEDIRRANAMSGQGEYLEPEGIGTSAVELMNLMSAVGSELSNIGKKQLKAMWLISPALRATDIYLQGKIMKSLAPSIVIIPEDRAIQWTHPTGKVQEIGFDLARYQVSEVNLAIPKSKDIPHKDLDCDRAVFVGGNWYSLDGLNDEKPELTTPIQQTLDIEEAIDLDDVWEVEDVAEEAVIETAVAPDIDAIKNRIARVMAMPGLTDDEKLDLIETLTK